MGAFPLGKVDPVWCDLFRDVQGSIKLYKAVSCCIISAVYVVGSVAKWFFGSVAPLRARKPPKLPY